MQKKISRTARKRKLKIRKIQCRCSSVSKTVIKTT